MSLPSIKNLAYQALAKQQLVEIDGLCDRFDLELMSGLGHSIEKYLVDTSTATRDGLLAELLVMELEYRVWRRNKPQQAEYSQRFPEQMHIIASIFARDEQASRSSQTPAAAINLATEPSLLLKSSDAENSKEGRASGEAVFRKYLQPTTRDCRRRQNGNMLAERGLKRRPGAAMVTTT